MEANPRVSVIVPVLNRVDTLEQALCSVLDQGYDNLQLLVADGGSTDGSVGILEHYPEIDWSVSEPDAGPADAVNKALAHCTGDVVVVLPADDVLLPGALTEAAGRLQDADGPAWLVGGCLRTDIRDETVGRVSAKRPRSLRAAVTFETGPLPAASTFYRRDALARFGAFDRAAGTAWAQEMACRFLAAGLEPDGMGDVAAKREPLSKANLDTMIRRGRDLLNIAEHHADGLTFGHRFRVNRDLAQRRAIYDRAEHEAATGRLKRALWSQLLRHPHWLASDNYRQSLLDDAPAVPLRRAA